MAVTKANVPPRDPKPSHGPSSPLARVMREFDHLVKSFEAGLLRSLQDSPSTDPHASSPDQIRREACRLAISDLSSTYTRKHLRRALDQAESDCKRVEEQLHSLSLDDSISQNDQLASLHNGHFRLYSTELFDLLGQPTELRLGTLRFHKHQSADPESQTSVSVELALNDSFFVADSQETLPYHTFRLPSAPSLQNRGILSRKPEDNGAFPEFDSWLLFTFLGNGCIKLEVPIEMCAHVYGERLQGRENEEVLFWGCFVDDEGEL